jgi:NAD(P)-dependent dehydrogenase (short-subunit alcohol dehydrogenase family)
MPFKNGFGKTWGLEGKVALIFGNNRLAHQISEVLGEEGVKVVNEFTPETSILITIPFDMSPTKIDSLNISPESWSARMRSLFEDPRQITQKHLPSIKSGKKGRVIHLIGSFEPDKFSVDYAAWGATAAWSKSITRALDGCDATVNMIQLGVFSGDPLMEKVPMGRGCTVSDITNLILFLCSDYSSYINGAIIPVDGGLSRFQR